ncbi:hypothetical protein BCR44DRAFT_65713 [Catenaria anguillulae PL171]|uniref:AMP-dependent synthetase/ligase domain-containing protein n=1 Tax=Catenaria anguillulae PL171 TaxID=765915 RepID=A0A1Y2HCN4_9FUNG|nr:hypothetical protein BCR44DRAFT_65713 [Catenaria anguillulae PL171]
MTIPTAHPAIFTPAAELNRSEYDTHGPNVANLLLAALARNQDRQPTTPAFVRAHHPDQVTTFADLLHGSVCAARAFVHKYNVQKGDRIVILAPNHLRWPVALLAGMLAGAPVVLVSPMLTPQEAADQVASAQGKVKVVVTIAAMVKLAQAVRLDGKVDSVVVVDL